MRNKNRQKEIRLYRGTFPRREDRVSLGERTGSSSGTPLSRPEE